MQRSLMFCSIFGFLFGLLFGLSFCRSVVLFIALFVVRLVVLFVSLFVLLFIDLFVAAVVEVLDVRKWGVCRCPWSSNIGAGVRRDVRAEEGDGIFAHSAIPLQASPKIFHWCVVVAITFATHVAGEDVFLKKTLVFIVSIVNATIRMNDLTFYSTHAAYLFFNVKYKKSVLMQLSIAHYDDAAMQIRNSRESTYLRRLK
ncbi:hypothetical protein AB4Z29_22590 [Paenibacillus sp. 2TAB23]|uniref:hypothetical protein n=1 Tax=Paenibacillus sp. 2TAB23 TaxID=3233004 RepID=UPI003F9875F5